MPRDTLAALVAEARDERLVKRMIAAAAATLPAGFVRLTDHPATHLLAVIDEVLPEQDEHAAEEPVPAHEQPNPTRRFPAKSLPNQHRRLMSRRPRRMRKLWMPPKRPFPLARAKRRLPRWMSRLLPVPPSTRRLPADGATAEAAEARQPEMEMAADTVADTDAPAEPIGMDAVAQAAEAGAIPQAAEIEAVAKAMAEADAQAAREAQPRIAVDRTAAPVRFVWKTDADGRFNAISEEFAAAVGLPAPDIIGRSFRDISQSFGLDTDGEIAGLLDRRDTWSGRSVLWPVVGTDLRIPVDLAALPVYDRARNFSGFRGFGVARAGDAVVDPEATGLALAKAKPADAAPPPGESAASDAPDTKASSEAVPTEDPFRGEVPILSIVPKQERRFTDKVIRLAEHRPPNGEKGLSPGERVAFREIGDRLKKESGVACRGAVGPGRAARRQRPDAAAIRAVGPREQATRPSPLPMRSKPTIRRQRRPRRRAELQSPSLPRCSPPEMTATPIWRWKPLPTTSLQRRPSRPRKAKRRMLLRQATSPSQWRKSAMPPKPRAMRQRATISRPASTLPPTTLPNPRRQVQMRLQAT